MFHQGCDNTLRPSIRHAQNLLPSASDGDDRVREEIIGQLNGRGGFLVLVKQAMPDVLQLPWICFIRLAVSFA